VAKYFKPSEFACPDCGLSKVDPELVQLLDDAREEFGRPIIITSGTRCPKHNKEVGGKPNSAHLVRPDGYSKAVDIRCLDCRTRYQLVCIFLSLGIERMEITNKHIHIDIANDLPQEIIDLAWV